MLAEKEKKVEKTNCLATGKTTKRTKKDHCGSRKRLDIRIHNASSSTSAGGKWKHLDTFGKRVPATNLLGDDEEKPIDHGEQRNDDEGQARPVEDVGSKSRSRAKHHGDEPEGEDDVEGSLELIRCCRIREEVLALGAQGGEEEPLTEDVERQEAYHVCEGNRKDLYFHKPRGKNQF